MSENEKRLENLDENDIRITFKTISGLTIEEVGNTRPTPMDAVVTIKTPGFLQPEKTINIETDYRAIPSCSVSGVWTWDVYWKKDGSCGFGWEPMYKADEYHAIEECEKEVMDDLKADGTVKDPELADFED